MQAWPADLEHDRVLVLASVGLARAMAGDPGAFLARAAAAFYDARRLCVLAAAYRMAGGRWSRRLVALRELIDAAAGQGLAYADQARIDSRNRAAFSGVVEMLAAVALYVESAGRGVDLAL